MRRAGVAVAIGVATLVVGWVGIAPGQAVKLGQLAPEITGESWINSEPLTLAALRGQVVFLEFWTYG